MRIMLDTNILFSAIVLRSKILTPMVAWIADRHTLVLSTYVMDECRDVVRRKKPSLLPALEAFFQAMPMEVYTTPDIIPTHDLFSIRDRKDEKVMYSAIDSGVDVLITGDKDFSPVKIPKPEILTVREFIDRYGPVS